MAIINRNKKDFKNKEYYASTVFFNITESHTDIYLRVTKGTRLDTISQKIYNDASLWWIIASINNLDLSDYCMSDEKVIRLPSPSRLPQILGEIRNSQIG